MSNDNPLNDINVRVIGRDDPDAEKKTVQLYAEDNTKGVKLPFKTEVTGEFTANNVPSLNSDDVGGIYLLNIRTKSEDRLVDKRFAYHGCIIYLEDDTWYIKYNGTSYELDNVCTFVPGYRTMSSTSSYLYLVIEDATIGNPYGLPLDKDDYANAQFQVLTPCMFQGTQGSSDDYYGYWGFVIARRIK